MTDTTPPSPDSKGPNVDPIGEIADLLHDGVEPQADTETTDQDDQEPETGDEPEQESQEEPSTEDETAAGELDERTLSQLLGLDTDQVSVDEESGDLLISAKVDGVQSQLKFKEVLAGYQSNKSNTQRSQALAAERKEFEKAAEAQIANVRQQLEYGAALTQQLQQELTKDFDNTDWNSLRVQDPAEYAAKQQDMQVRYNQIQGIQGQVEQQRQQRQQEAGQLEQQNREKFIAGQRDIMLDQVPEWRDPAEMKAGMTEVRVFLSDTYGFTDEDISQVVEARQVEIIRDAMAYRAGKKVSDNKVAKLVPKMQKSKTTKRRTKSTKLDRLTKAAKAAKGADRRSAEVDAVAELLS